MFHPSPALRIDTKQGDEKTRTALEAVVKDIEGADFVVWSDASAIYDNGIGAWACRVYSEKYQVCQTDIGVLTNTNTNRAELQGLLSGLIRIDGLIEKLRLRSPGWVPRIVWVGDRENLIIGISEDSWRKKDRDLWAAYEEFERMRGWRISARHVPRDCAIPDHDDLDRLASELYLILKHYITTNSPSFPLEATALDLKK